MTRRPSYWFVVRFNVVRLQRDKLVPIPTYDIDVLNSHYPPLPSLSLIHHSFFILQSNREA